MKQQPKVKLMVVRNAIKPTPEDIEEYAGDSIEALLKQAFPFEAMPDGVKLYANGFTTECEVSLKTKADVNKFMKTRGTVYAVLQPQGFDPISWVALGAGFALSLLSMTLMPKVVIPYQSRVQSSPNNAFANRQNTVRTGGRVLDLYGTNYTYPDMIAPVYQIYVGNDEYEYSLQCIGRGSFAIHNAYDDKTPINEIAGSCVEFYRPKQINGVYLDNNFLDHLSINPEISTVEPYLRIGNKLVGKPLHFKEYYAKRYNSVNGQNLSPPDKRIESDSLSVTGEMRITASDYDFSEFNGYTEITISDADDLQSANRLTEADGVTTVTYNLNGTYAILEVGTDYIQLGVLNEENPDFTKLQANTDTTEGGFTLTTEAKAVYSDTYYTDYDTHEELWLSFVSDSGLYSVTKTVKKKWYQLTAKEIVKYRPISLNYVAELTLINGAGVEVKKAHARIVMSGDVNARSITLGYGEATAGFEGYNELGAMSEEKVVKPANETFKIDVKQAFGYDEALKNPFKVAIKVRRVSHNIEENDKYKAMQNVKLKDFYSAKKLYTLQNEGLSNGLGGRSQSFIARGDVTLCYMTQKATPSALKIRDRKLKVLCTRNCYTPDYQEDGTQFVLSRKADDIIVDMMNDDVIAPNLKDKVYNYATGASGVSALIDVEQMKLEFQKVRDYFGNDDVTDFCYGFDDKNISFEEMVQTVAQAAFCQAYYVKGMIYFNFEQKQDAPTFIFNNTNMVAGTYNRVETTGNAKQLLGVKMQFKDPQDDANVVKYYPPNYSGIEGTSSVSNDNVYEEVKVVGVRNTVQAYFHMTRHYHKLLFNRRSLEFQAGDEANLLVNGMRIDVVNQSNHPVAQGAVHGLGMVNGKVAITSNIPMPPIAYSYDPEIVEDAGYTCHIQSGDGGIESINVSGWDANGKYLYLQRMPTMPISSSPDTVVQSAFTVYDNSVEVGVQNNETAWLVVGKEPQADNTCVVTAIAYSNGYFRSDKDFTDGKIPSEYDTI